MLSILGVTLYAVAVVRYLRLPRHPASSLPLAMAGAFTLLAEAEIAIAWGRNWHASWWEWHLLMLAAFVLIAVSAQRSWREERWVGLYREDTASSEREISVVFADLQGFTTLLRAARTAAGHGDAQQLLQHRASRRLSAGSEVTSTGWWATRSW